jgi:hypothetical protein
MKVDKRKLDVSQVFLTYTALVGDVAKTAVALDLDPEIVDQLARDEGWNSKLQRVCLMSKGGKPGDFERAQNRALCFVQGHRLRTLLDGLLVRLQDLTPEQLADELTVTGAKGARHISARFVADLAAAAEKAHGLTYAALGDTAGERAHRDSPDEEMNASALHAAVLSALSAPNVGCKSADVLVRELASGVDMVVSQLKAESNHEQVTHDTERTEAEPTPKPDAPNPLI